MRQVTFEPSLEAWRRAARDLLKRAVPPEAVTWVEATSEQSTLQFSSDCEAGEEEPAAGATLLVPKAFVTVATSVALHSDSRRWSLLYRVLWRLTHGEPKLLETPIDPDRIALSRLDNAVQKDAYRMRAFLRFRETRLDGEPWFVAWYEPEHDTVALNQEFFVERFANLRWSILTPARCMHWDGTTLALSGGARKSLAPAGDDVERLWIEYYSNIFNPARMKPAAMQAQLLKRNWKNLPEAAVIEPLLREAPRRTASMIERSEFLRVRDSDYGVARPPAAADLEQLRSAAAGCRACPLWKTTTCTVFGEGPRDARIVLVGEQPGDQEDRAGRPFVGPAGQVLNDALAQAGIDRSSLYVTNAVKHFKFEPRGKRRMHKTPGQREIDACRPWLEAELRVLRPSLIVALGTTATRSIFQAPVRVTEERGRVLTSEFGSTLVTLHPSALLRLPPDRNFQIEFERFVADLRHAQSGALHADAVPAHGILSERIN